MSVGISLGWRCEAAVVGVGIGLRSTKNEGYKTCPFDMGVCNYIGMCKCIEDDFKHFCDIDYLFLKKEPFLQHVIDGQTTDQYWIYNKYYNFAFNHESPGHGNLFESEKWAGGKFHFVSNNFEKFIERYTNRINNFRHYLKSKDLHINFLLLRYNAIPYELEAIIKKKYPELKFTIHCFVNISENSINMCKDKTKDCVIQFELEYVNYLNNKDSEYDKECLRYTTDFDQSKFYNIIGNNIKIYY